MPKTKKGFVWRQGDVPVRTTTTKTIKGEAIKFSDKPNPSAKPTQQHFDDAKNSFEQKVKDSGYQPHQVSSGKFDTRSKKGHVSYQGEVSVVNVTHKTIKGQEVQFSDKHVHGIQPTQKDFSKAKQGFDNEVARLGYQPHEVSNEMFDTRSGT